MRKCALKIDKELAKKTEKNRTEFSTYPQNFWVVSMEALALWHSQIIVG